MKIKKHFKIFKYIFSKNKTKEYLFPCKECLVRASCNFSKPCDKLEINEEKILEIFLKHKCCPDCGGKAFYEGPSGGASLNVKCTSCGHKFNMSLPFFVQRIDIPGRMFGVDQSP
jgi:transcription elongation factor Elf1